MWWNCPKSRVYGRQPSVLRRLSEERPVTHAPKKDETRLATKSQRHLLGVSISCRSSEQRIPRQLLLHSTGAPRIHVACRRRAVPCKSFHSYKHLITDGSSFRRFEDRIRNRHQVGLLNNIISGKRKPMGKNPPRETAAQKGVTRAQMRGCNYLPTTALFVRRSTGRDYCFSKFFRCWKPTSLRCCSSQRRKVDDFKLGMDLGGIVARQGLAQTSHDTKTKKQI